MKCTIVGSRYFGASVLEAFRNDGIEIAGVVAPSADDRLAVAGREAGLPTVIHENPRLVEGSAIPEDTGLIVAAHTHARVSDEALARSRLGGVGYHPSLLPRHRGIAAVEWTILEGDPIAGGSIYHLSHGWDAGAITAQDWCFVKQGENARELWERALAPMGLALLLRVAHHAREHGELPAIAQDEQFATRAPIIRRRIELAEEPSGPLATLVVTAIGADRQASSTCFRSARGPLAPTGPAAAWRVSAASSPAWCSSKSRSVTPTRSPPHCAISKARGCAS